VYVICRISDENDFRRKGDGMLLLFDTLDQAEDWIAVRQLQGSWYARKLVGRDWAKAPRRASIKKSISTKQAEDRQP
jgi:hypothetical protein